MKEQYVLRKYWTPNDGELVTADDERELVLSQYELGAIYIAVSRVNERTKMLCGVNTDELLNKLQKLEKVVL